MQDIRRIKVVSTTSPNVRVYGVSRQTSTSSFGVQIIRDISEDSKTLQRITPETLTVVNQILALSGGILELRVRPFEVEVHKAAVFEWEDVHDDIINILRQAYFPSPEVEVVGEQ